MSRSAVASSAASPSIRSSTLASSRSRGTTSGLIALNLRDGDERGLLELAGGGDVAGCTFFLASEDAAYVTGQVLQVNGGALLGRWS